MKITLRAKVELYLFRTVDVNSVDDLCAAEIAFYGDIHQEGRFDTECGEIEYETGDFIDYVTILDDSYFDHGELRNYIAEIDNDPNHPLHVSDYADKSFELNETDNDAFSTQHEELAYWWQYRE